MKVRYTKTAPDEIDEISSLTSPTTTCWQLGALSTRSSTPSDLWPELPQLGPIKYRQSVRVLPIRRFPEYLLFYAIEPDCVVILNIRHAARQPPWEEEKG
ncbi:MAG: type II toxin-antitoxin system RelE/ParE family toxin [Hyphomicrobiales bacterium]|nr:type II toxin-antitoxin system RelE/ParE family toxin [Hyphomicrobiales bacterium]